MALYEPVGCEELGGGEKERSPSTAWRRSGREAKYPDQIIADRTTMKENIISSQASLHRAM
jgi:hypothetical protein